MKLALNFLLVFIAVSCSQRLPKKQPWSLLSLPMPYYSPRALIHLPNPYILDNPLESDFDEEVIDTNWESDFIQSQSRNGNRFRPNSLQGQQRFFFGAFNPLNSNGFTPFWRTGSTVVTVTVSTTLTTAVISSCVPATQLAAGAANIPCARKRRNVVESFDDSFLDVSPSLVQSVEPTEIPRERRQVDYQQAISSSKDEEFSSGNNGGDIRRQNRALLTTVTMTSTSYIFSSAVIKKTLNIAASAGLSFLPSGFLVC